MGQKYNRTASKRSCIHKTIEGIELWDMLRLIRKDVHIDYYADGDVKINVNNTKLIHMFYAHKRALN